LVVLVLLLPLVPHSRRRLRSITGTVGTHRGRSDAVEQEESRLMRGIRKVAGEFDLVSLALNLRRMTALSG